MKIIITESQLKKILNEDIHPRQALDDMSSLKTVANGKRNLGVISFIKGQYKLHNKMKDIIELNDLNLLRIPSNPFNFYVVYRDGSENDAKELRDIAEKYNGYLSTKATEEDTLRIGRLLGYKEKTIQDFINGRKNNT